MEKLSLFEEKGQERVNVLYSLIVPRHSSSPISPQLLRKHNPSLWELLYSYDSVRVENMKGTERRKLISAFESFSVLIRSYFHAALESMNVPLLKPILDYFEGNEYSEDLAAVRSAADAGEILARLRRTLLAATLVLGLSTDGRREIVPIEHEPLKNGDVVKYAGGRNFLFVGKDPYEPMNAYCVDPKYFEEPKEPQQPRKRKIESLPLNRLERVDD